MADSQVPWGVEALGGTITEPAWRSKPSWYLVATEDRMIPPPAQRQMSKRAGSTVVEVSGSHSVYVSQPAAVAELIEKAASEVTLGRALMSRARRPGNLVPGAEHAVCAKLHAFGLLRPISQSEPWRHDRARIVSERKRRQPGLATDGPEFIGWHQLVRGIQGSQVDFDFVGAASRKRTSRSGDRKTARHSRVFRPRSSPHPPGTPRTREKARHDACGSRDSGKRRPGRASRRHNPDVAAQATAGELVHAAPPLKIKRSECAKRTPWGVHERLRQLSSAVGLTALRKKPSTARVGSTAATTVLV